MKKLHILVNPTTREMLLPGDTYNDKNTKLSIPDKSLQNILAMIDMMWDTTKNTKIYDKTINPSDYFNIKENNNRPEDFVSWVGRIFPFVYSYAIAGELKHGDDDEIIKKFFINFIDNDTTDKVLLTKDNPNPSIREIFTLMADAEYINTLICDDTCGCSYNE